MIVDFSDEDKNFKMKEENDRSIKQDEVDGNSGIKICNSTGDTSIFLEDTIIDINAIECDQTREIIVNISELENKNMKTNSDFILFMYEYCLNLKEYGMSENIRDRKLWKESLVKNKFTNILKHYSEETWRKYWRLLRSAKDSRSIITRVKNNKKSIDSKGLK
jgi:hypothetical protein